MIFRIIILCFILLPNLSLESDDLFFDKPVGVSKCSFSTGCAEDTSIEFIVYIESHCAICAYEQIFEWNDYFTQKSFNHEIVSMKLYVNSDMEELYALFRDDKVEITVYDDKHKDFIKKNENYRTVLLVDNKIKCIGNPMKNRIIDSKCINIIYNYLKI